METNRVESQGQVAGRVVAIWRYPVKSMLGEEVDAAELTERGLLGDRAYALVDAETGKVASAKNPRRWPGLFDFRAAYPEPPRDDRAVPPARITLTDGEALMTDQADVEARLSAGVGRPVRLARSAVAGTTAEGYWPDHDWLAQPDEVFEFPLPPGTFFDAAPVHLVTTATLDRLRALAPASRFEAPRFRPNLVIEPTGGPGGGRRGRLDRPDADAGRRAAAGRRPLSPLRHDDAGPGQPAQGPAGAPHHGPRARR